MSKIAVLIVDDSAVVRQVLQAQLSAHPDIEVMGSAARSDLGDGANEVAVAGCDRARCRNATHGWHHVPQEDHERTADAGGDLLHPH